MKKLPEPNNTEAPKQLQLKIARKQINEHKDCLEENQYYILSRYSIFDKNKHNLKHIGNSTLSKKIIKDALHSLFNESFTDNVKEGVLLEVYQQCRRVCPYCGEGRIEELDHYLPKETYAEYTIYPRNLIPICSKCNKKKSKKFLDKRSERKFINYYYDEIDKIDFLEIKIDYDVIDIKNSLIAKYYLNFKGITDLKMITIIKNHFENLDLLNRYKEYASTELSHIYDMLSNQSCRDPVKLKVIAIGIIEGEKNTQFKYFGRNDWRFLFYIEIMKSSFLDLFLAEIILL